MASNGPPPASSAAANSWRDSVAQSYRNKEARGIAKTLAELEPGATATGKLSLALRFENTVFQSASSLEDYRKRLARRLKKLRKNYKPPEQQKTGNDALLQKSNVTSKEELYHVLREKYGQQLLYIVQNAHKAVQDVLLRNGKAKSTQLQQHTDCAVTWASQLGLIDAADTALAKKGQLGQNADPASATTSATPTSTAPATVTASTTASNTTKSNNVLPNKRKREEIPSDANLLKLQQHLEKRVANIRQYVVKHADADLFLQETLERKDKELKPRANEFISRQLKQRMQKLASNSGTTTTTTSTTTTTTTVSNGANTTTAAGAEAEAAVLEGMALLQDAMEKAQVPIPPSTRSQSNDKVGAKLYVDKMRAASTAFVTYLTMADRHKETTMAPAMAQSILPKTNAIVKEGVAFLKEVVEKYNLNEDGTTTTTMTTTSSSNNSQTNGDKSKEGKKIPPLQDAWNKVMELPTLEEEETLIGGGATGDEITSSGSDPAGVPSPPKRQRRSPNGNLPPCTKAKVLFRAKRRTPANLLPALKRKRATLVRPKPDGHGSHLVLDFGSFSMTIYFSPLLVTLRANEDDSDNGENGSNDNENNNTVCTRHFRTRPSTGCASWKPLHFGLAHRRQPNDLTVFGVSQQSYDAVGGVVEERLRDASTQATHTLRTCFANHVKDKQHEIEVEILEGSALLEFLQVARSTYMPNWKDEDVDF